MSEEKNGKLFIVFIFLLIFLIVIGIWVYLIRTNNFINLGEKLRPKLKDIPIISMVLPPPPDLSDPMLFTRENLEEQYKVYYKENEELKTKVAELQKETADAKDIKSKYEILLRQVEAGQKEETKNSTQILDPEAENEVKTTPYEDKIKNMVKTYEAMDAKESAKILEQMGALNIGLVVDICQEMTTGTRGKVMQEMDTDFAAILSERIIQN